MQLKYTLRYLAIKFVIFLIEFSLLLTTCWVIELFNQLRYKKSIVVFAFFLVIFFYNLWQFKPREYLSYIFLFFIGIFYYRKFYYWKYNSKSKLFLLFFIEIFSSRKKTIFFSFHRILSLPFTCSLRFLPIFTPVEVEIMKFLIIKHGYYTERKILQTHRMTEGQVRNMSFFPKLWYSVT